MNFFPSFDLLRRPLAAAPLLLGLAAPAQAQTTEAPAAPSMGSTRYRATAIGFTPLGWDAPYGFGLELSHFVSRRTELNAGVGLSFSGTKAGAGLRYYLSPEKRVSSYFGLNVVQSGGWQEITLREGGGDDWYEGDGVEIGTLTVKPTTLVHLRYGLRWQPGREPGRVGLIGSVGYGLRVSGNPMRYRMNDGYEPSSFDQLVYRTIYAPGGLELSLGLSIGLGKKMRE